MSKSKDMMTIKELADSLNLPKNKINYQVSKLDSNYIVNLNGIKHLKKEAQVLIKEALGVEEVSSLDSKLNTDLNSFEHLVKQLENKDDQINKLHTLLDQQQQLTLQGNRQIEQLQLKLGEVEEKSKEDTTTDDIETETLKKTVLEQQQQLNNLLESLAAKEAETLELKTSLSLKNDVPQKGFWARLFNLN